MQPTKNTFKLLTFILVMSFTTACNQNKTDEEPVQSTTFTVNGESFEMIFVEGGTFTMGCTNEQGDDCEPNEKPAHKETVSSFYIGKYEVTQKLWNAVMGPDVKRSHNTGCEDCPAENISWKDAQVFLSRLTILTGKVFRLPTEVEWEYAARGGQRSRKYKYSGSDNIDEVAWYIGNSKQSKYGDKGTTHPVGMKKPNELGIYDMSGNVWEWCEDAYAKEYYHNGKRVNQDWPIPGSPRLFRRVLRGGSWGGTAKGCRVSYCDYDMGSYSDEYGGFRLALGVDSVDRSVTESLHSYIIHW